MGTVFVSGRMACSSEVVAGFGKERLLIAG
jgi:hypothetical protein